MCVPDEVDVPSSNHSGRLDANELLIIHHCPEQNIVLMIETTRFEPSHGGHLEYEASLT